MLIYASFPTERLSEREAQELSESLGGAEQGLLDIHHAERCLSQEFTIIDKMVIGSQAQQHSVERDKDKSQAAEDLLKVARMLTWPDRYIEKFGEKNYTIVLAEAHWCVYILLGKVEPTVFVVQNA